MSSRPVLPRRVDKLLVQSVAGEMVVFNPADDRAHCLRGATAEVFALCDGKTLRHHMELSELELDSILASLADLGLIRMEFASRRDFVKGALTLGAITTLAIPLPAAADSSACAAAMCGPGTVLASCICTFGGMVPSMCFMGTSSCATASTRCTMFCSMFTMMVMMMTVTAMVQTFDCCEC